MEEFLALFIQLVLEVGLQLFGSLGFDAATTSRDRTDKEKAGCWWLVLFAVFGAICGGLSLIFAPQLMLPNLGLRLANLIVAPLLAGTISYLVARYVWTSKGLEPSHHFWRGFWFALFFGLCRFAFAKH